MRIVLCFLIIFSTFLCTVSANPEIRINIPEYILTVTDKGQLIKKYAIAVGTPYEQTPTGNFTIFVKLENPTWYPGSKFSDRTPVPPGPANPLGTRWMEFYPSYGIHGTNKDWDISYPVSGGCIRMHDSDARELYEIAPIGTPVTIVYETLLLTEKQDGLYLKILPDVYLKHTTTQERLMVSLVPYNNIYQVSARLAFPLPASDETYEIRLAVRRESLPPVITATADQNSQTP